MLDSLKGTLLLLEVLTMSNAKRAIALLALILGPLGAAACTDPAGPRPASNLEQQDSGTKPAFEQQDSGTMPH